MMAADIGAKRAVYTTLFGGYEELLPQPRLRVSDIDAFCFTDDPDLVSEEWKVVHVPRRMPADVVRSQREVKIRFSRYLGEYEEVLYIDNSVQLTVVPEKILDEWLIDSDMTVIEHSFRERLLDEFDEVARLHYDDAVRVHEQLWDYARVRPKVLEGKPLWTGLMARRNIPEVNEVMELWYENILRYSRRDQLSVLFVLAARDFRLHTLQRDNAESEWHLWRMSGTRRVRQGKRPPLPPGPLAADLLRGGIAAPEVNAENAQLRQRVAELEAAQGSLQDTRAVLESTLEASRAETAAATAVAEQRAECVETLLSEQQAMARSTSWKITAPLRSVTNKLRRRS